MRNSNKSGFFWFILFIFLFSGGFSFLPLFIIIAVVVSIAMAASNSANKQDRRNSSAYERGYRRTRSTQRSRTNLSASQMAKVNVYMRKFFRSNRTMKIGTGIELKTHGTSYASLSSLDVYRNGSFICSLDEFGKRYPDSYKELMDEICRRSDDGQSDIFEAEIQETPKEEVHEQPKQKTTPKEQSAQYFIDTINDLNNGIPDEEISNGLFETTALLKQVQSFELKFPNSRTKLSKLYEYYLPILVRILKQYETLQDAKLDENYETVKEKLKKTIHLINDAMKTIIKSMTDADMMNLSADLTTLESLLQKDGLTQEGTMQSLK